MELDKIDLKKCEAIAQQINLEVLNGKLLSVCELSVALAAVLVAAIDKMVPTKDIAIPKMAVIHMETLIITLLKEQHGFVDLKEEKTNGTCH